MTAPQIKNLSANFLLLFDRHKSIPISHTAGARLFRGRAKTLANENKFFTCKRTHERGGFLKFAHTHVHNTHTQRTSTRGIGVAAWLRPAPRAVFAPGERLPCHLKHVICTFNAKTGCLLFFNTHRRI